MPTKAQIINAIRNTGIMPVFYHHDVSIAKHVIDACHDEGIRIFEFTNRGSNAFQVFETLLDHVQQYPDFMLGIGTILDAGTARKFIDAGAHFIVSPIIAKSIAEECNRHNTLSIPGCATVTEIVTAKECGADIIKIFPASVLGPQFFSSVMPVIPGLQLMPTGGIEPTAKDLASWFNAGVICVGMGSQLFSKDIINNKDWGRLRFDIAQTMEIIKKLKNRTEALALAKL